MENDVLSCVAKEGDFVQDVFGICVSCHAMSVVQCNTSIDDHVLRRFLYFWDSLCDGAHLIALYDMNHF